MYPLFDRFISNEISVKRSISGMSRLEARYATSQPIILYSFVSFPYYLVPLTLQMAHPATTPNQKLMVLNVWDADLSQIFKKNKYWTTRHKAQYHTAVTYQPRSQLRAADSQPECFLETHTSE
jgi:hypothetical protein